MAQDPWDTAKPVDNPDEAPPAPEQAAPSFPGDDLLKGPPLPELNVDLSKPYSGGHAPPGSEGQAFKFGVGAIRFGTELGAEFIGQKIMAPVKGARAVIGLGRRAFGAGMGGATASVANDRANLAGGPPPTIDEIGRNAVRTGVQGAAGEGLAAGVAKAWNTAKGAIGATRAGRPFAGYVTDQGREASAYLGGHVSPSQMTDSYAVGALESVLKGTPFGGGRFRKFFREQDALLKSKAAGILDQFGPRRSAEEAGDVIVAGLRRELGSAEQRMGAEKLLGEYATQTAQAGTAGVRQTAIDAIGPARQMEDVGKTWQALQDAAHESARAGAKKLYQSVDEVADGVLVPLGPMREAVDAEVTKRSKLGMALAPGPVKGTAGSVIRATTPEDDVVDEGTQLAQASMARAQDPGAMIARPGHVDAREQLKVALADAGVSADDAGEIPDLTFDQAHEVRASIGRMIRTAERSSDPNAQNSLGFLKKMYATVDNTMTEAAGGKDTDLRVAYDAAGKAWKDMAQTFQEGLLADVAEKEPRMVVSTLIQPGRVDDIKKAQKAVGPKGWKAVQQAHLDSLFRGDTGGWADAKTLQKRLAKLTPETIDAVYGRRGSARITDYVKSMLSTEELAKLGTGGDAAKEVAAIQRRIPQAFEAVARTIRDNDARGAEKLRQLVGEEDWKAVQSAYAQKLMMGHGETLVKGDVLLDRLHKASPETLSAVFPGGKAEGLWQFARVLAQVQKKGPGSGVAQVSAPFMQFGSVVALMTGAIGMRTALLLGGPSVMARIAMSPSGRQFLTTGLKAAKDTDPSTANRAFSQLATWAVKEGLIDAADAGAAVRGGPPQPTVPQPPASGRGAGPGPGPRVGGPPPTPTLDRPVAAPQ